MECSRPLRTIDAAHLAERRQTGRPEQRASLARARHGSLLEEEREGHAISEALRLAHQTLRAIDQGHVQAMHDLLRDLNLALRDAHAFVQESDCGPQQSGALTTLLGGAL